MDTDQRSTRRGFLEEVGTVAVPWVLAASTLGSPLMERGKVGIARLRLKTQKPAALRDFYGRTLGLKVTETAGGFTVGAGDTEITFEATTQEAAPPDGTRGPFYHVAFNIPENKLAASKEWLRERCEIVTRPDGGDEYHFVSWNAHAVYFLDPAGNILEFIARHSLQNPAEGAFSEADILYASEIALAVDDVRAAAKAAGTELGMPPFAGSLSDEFAAVGSDHALLIIVKRGRPWLGGKGSTAQVYATGAEIRAIEPGHFAVEGRPYNVTSGV